MEGMQPQGQGAPAAAQGQPEGQPQGGDPGEAVAMVGQGMQTLIKSAPTPEIAQQLEGLMQQIGQILSQGQGQGSQPVSPEAGANPGARPVG